VPVAAYALAVRRPRPAALLAFAIVLVVTGGCSVSVGTEQELDLAKARREVRALVERAYGDEVDVGKAMCPEKVVEEKGDTFTCTVSVEGQDLAVGLRQTDGDGNVSMRVLEAVISNAKAEEFVAAYASRRGTPTQSVVCGSGPVSVRLPGERITCTVTFRNGREGQARLQVADVEGRIGLQQLTPAS
jgi:hypothetical protein